MLCNLNFYEFRDDAGWAYSLYYEAARKFSEQDQMNDVAFTVALDPEGIEFGEFTDAALIRLFLWNNTITLVSMIVLKFCLENSFIVCFDDSKVLTAPPDISCACLDSRVLNSVDLSKHSTSHHLGSAPRDQVSDSL